MSDNNLAITLNAETNFEFELTVKGIDVNEADVRFGIEKNGVRFQFSCASRNGAWSVNIPPLINFGLKEGLYKYTIEVIANGYYFAPVKGTAEVTPAAEVTGSMIKKDVKVAVSGIKVTEGKKHPVKKRPDTSHVNKKPLTEHEKKAMDQNKFNSGSMKSGLSRLQELAGIK